MTKKTTQWNSIFKEVEERFELLSYEDCNKRILCDYGQSYFSLSWIYLSILYYRPKSSTIFNKSQTIFLNEIESQQGRKRAPACHVVATASWGLVCRALRAARGRYIHA